MKPHWVLSSLVALVAIALGRPLVADEAAPPGGVQAVLVTVDDEQLSGKITGLADGKLNVATDPPRAIALVDLQRIEIGKVIASGASSDVTWIGQDKHDLVQVGGASGGNGIQDIHLHVANLKSQGIKQIEVLCRFQQKQVRMWRLDTSKSPHWRVAIARADLASDAELYLEPASADAYGEKFEVTITYNDNSKTANTTTGGTHTSDELKVDNTAKPGQPVVAKAASPTTVSKTIVYLGSHRQNQGRLHGGLARMSGETLALATDWKQEIEIPLLRVSGIWFGKSTGRAEFDKQLAAPAGEDTVLLTASDGTLAQIQCSVLGFGEGKLNVRYDDADRSIKDERLLGIVFAAHPDAAPNPAPFQVFTLASGDSISGTLAAVSEQEFEIETLWQSRVKLPSGGLADIRFRNGKLTFLSDLEPISVEETAYFGRVIHWRRDLGFDDTPARVKGRQVTRCLAMHSRSVLVFALDDQYEKFKTRLGFDDSAGNRGQAACRVLVDGREAFANKNLRSDQDTLDVEVAVKGAKQLALEVDFGEGEDVGDRIIWAEPRLFRAAAN
jgi:hypothetical protein